MNECDHGKLTLRGTRPREQVEGLEAEVEKSCECDGGEDADGRARAVKSAVINLVVHSPPHPLILIDREIAKSCSVAASTHYTGTGL